MTSEHTIRSSACLVSASLLLMLPAPVLAAPPVADETSDASPAEGDDGPSAGQAEGRESSPAEGSGGAVEAENDTAGPSEDPAEVEKPEPEPALDADATPEGESTSDTTSETAPEDSADEAAPAPEQPKAIDPSNEGKSAQELFHEGQDAYALGDYALATTKFEAAWEASNEPALLFNLGQAYWQWHAVEPDLRYLRRARKLFENYDKFMVELGDEGYSSSEVEGILAAIDAQLLAAEQAEVLRAQLLAQPTPEGFDYAELEAERRRRATKALTISGSLLITVGALALAAGAAGLIMRGATGYSLDQSGGGEAGQNNPNSAEDDARLRSTYLLGGQIAFGGLIGGAALLPIGITLRVIGGARARKDRDQSESLALAPGPSLVTVQF